MGQPIKERFFFPRWAHVLGCVKMYSHFKLLDCDAEIENRIEE